MAERDGSLQHLVVDAIRDAVDLVRQEVALFKAEMASNVTGIVKAVAFFAAAAMFAMASLIWLTQALVYGLVLITQSWWISALIVGILLLAVAGGLALLGKSYLSASALTPSRTVRSLKRDGEILSERVG